MGRDRHGDSHRAQERVERTLRQCLEWSREGCHRKIVSEVNRVLDEIDDDRLQAALLTWKAQAHLAMGNAEDALPPATRSWDLDPSPQACHLKSSALEALGDAERSEELLRMGWRLFPDAVHLPVQLAVNLSDRARVPEALDILEEVGDDRQVPEDIQVFLFGLRANLLALIGRWSEADDVLRNGLGCYPRSRLLEEAHQAVKRARDRSKAEKVLANSWREGLSEAHGVAVEVDEAIGRCCAVHELSELLELAARRLWRDFLRARSPRPQSPDVWAAAVVLAVLELDGEHANCSAFARSFACNPSSVHDVLQRFRSYLASLDPELCLRAFAAHSNPRLGDEAGSFRDTPGPAQVVRFPGS
jgi:tetratricopeptide (TPR) repeat protein